MSSHLALLPKTPQHHTATSTCGWHIATKVVNISTRELNDNCLEIKKIITTYFRTRTAHNGLALSKLRRHSQQAFFVLNLLSADEEQQAPFDADEFCERFFGNGRQLLSEKRLDSALSSHS
jgi:hypothetical protein